MNQAVSDYWFEHYIGPDGLCLLCKNSGIIKFITTPQIGLTIGTAQFCLCPNGQQLRETAKGGFLHPGN